MAGNDPNEMPESLGYGNLGGQEESTTEVATEPTDELDELAGDMDDAANEDDPIDRDLGWTADEDEEEPETDSEPSEEEGQEDVDEPSEEDTEEDEDLEGEELEDEEKPEDAEEGDDEFLYDAERDFPDSDVQPTKYKDRISLNSGFTEKVRYLREQKEQIEEFGGRFGAIPLPDYFNGNESKIDETVDREAIANMSDEEAKKAIHDLDVAIKRSTSKADRLETQYKQQQKEQEVTEEYQQAVDNLAGALDTIGVDIEQAQNMKVNEIAAKADEAIAELEKDENAREFIEEHDAKAWRDELQRLENAKQTVRDFPEKARKAQEAKKSNDQPEFDPELTKTTYEGFKQDRPDHEVFEGETKAREEDFLEYVRGKIERQEITPPQHERDWVSQANDYVDMIESEKQKYQQRKEKKTKKSKSSKTTTADDSPVEKDKSQKPSSRDVAGQRSRRDIKTTRDIDDDLDRLAQEMNS